VFIGGDSVPQHTQSTYTRRESFSAPRTSLSDPQVTGAEGTRATTAGTASSAQVRATVRRRSRSTASGTQNAS